MHPRITELLAHLDYHHQRLLAAVDRVPVALRAVRPGPEAWSVAEVMEHLAIVNSRIARNISDRSATARKEGQGPDPEVAPVVPTFDMARALDRTVRLEAPPAIRPAEAFDHATVGDRMEQEFGALASAVRESDGVNLAALVMPHARFGPLNLYQWAVFAGAHEARHAEQVADIGKALMPFAGGD